MQLVALNLSKKFAKVRGGILGNRKISVVHTPEQIKQIKKSIEEFGMNDPLKKK